MEKVEKINELKKQIEEEGKKATPNQYKIKRLILQIAHLGIGLEVNNTQKPFTHV